MIPAPGPPLTALAVYGKENDFGIYGYSPEIIIGRRDSQGALWVWQDFEGYFDSAPFDAITSQQGSSDYGTWSEHFPRQLKTMTIHGTCYTGDKTRAFAARERLIRYWGDPDRVYDLVVDEPTGPKQMEVRLAAPLSPPWSESVGHARGFTFEVPLIARDPLKYSVELINASTGATTGSDYFRTYPKYYPLIYETVDIGADYATLYNDGNVASAPTTRIAGGDLSRGWRLQNLDDDGKTVWVDVALGSSDVLKLDHKTGLIYINESLADVPIYGDWWNLVPGTNRIQFLSVNFTDAIVSVTGRSAWR